MILVIIFPLSSFSFPSVLKSGASSNFLQTKSSFWNVLPWIQVL